MPQIFLKSFAKINLALHILGKREDSYHNIWSIMQAIDLADDLFIETIPSGIQIETNLSTLPLDKKNLAYQAAEMILKDNQVQSGVKIKIEKSIPLESGLGGGSSNAALTLKGINQLFGLNLPKGKLLSYAEKIGSDVPFFFSSGQAQAEGRGEIINEVKLFSDYWLVLVKPDFGVSTKWAYENVKIDLTKTGKEINFMLCQTKLKFFEALDVWHNDLEEVVKRNFPKVGEIEEILKMVGGKKVSLSGSGPTVFAVFESKSKAEEVREKLKRRDWQIMIARPIPL
jgi:4-diphosphocytidyl-2-C-methyl-D-erythritol kinase